MGVFDHLGRFLDRGTEVLGEAAATLQAARDTLTLLRPTLERLPGLVQDTHALVNEARALARHVEDALPSLVSQVGELASRLQPPRS